MYFLGGFFCTWYTCNLIHGEEQREERIILFLVCVFLEYLHLKSKQSCVLFRVGVFLKGRKKINWELKLPSFCRISKRREKEPHIIFLCLWLFFKCGLWDFHFFMSYV